MLATGVALHLMVIRHLMMVRHPHHQAAVRRRIRHFNFEAG